MTKLSIIISEAKQTLLTRLDGVEFTARLHPFMSEPASVGLPFPDWANDPEPIGQIKKLVNAFYHIEQAALIIDQNLPALTPTAYATAAAELFMSTLADPIGVIPAFTLRKIQQSHEFVHHTYQVAYVLTHIGGDLHEIFHGELATLAGFAEQLQAIPSSYFSNDAIATYAHNAYSAGVISGASIKRLNHVNAAFITQFGLELPKYLNKMAEYVRSFSSKPVEIVPDPPNFLDEIDKLRVGGISLLNNTFYMTVFRPMLALQTDIINEISPLNGAKKEVVLEKLQQIKYKIIPNCLAFVDKLEQQMLLWPGQLSHPVLLQFQEMHHQLRRTLPAFFLPDDGAIWHLEDDDFTTYRMANAYQRWARDSWQEEQLAHVRDRCVGFFRILVPHQGLRLSQIDPVTKQQLVEQFRLIQPHFAVIDLKLSNVIVKSLSSDDSAVSLSERVYDGLDRVTLGGLKRVTDYPDRIDRILMAQPALYGRLDQLKLTYRFNLRLDEDLMHHVYAPSIPDLQDRTRFIEESCVQAKQAHIATMQLGPVDEQLPLIPDLEGEKKATKVVKSPAYSQAVSNLCDKLSALIEMSLPQIQEQLKPAGRTFAALFSKLPFPEVDNYYTVPDLSTTLLLLKQPSQVLACKLLANSLYHLKGACLELERLDETSTKIIYIQRVIKIAYHANLAYQQLNLAKKDSFLLALTADLGQLIFGLWHEINAVKRDYLPADGFEFAVQQVADDFDFDHHGLTHDRPTLIKRGHDYFIYGCPDSNVWRWSPKLNPQIIEKAGICFNTPQIIPYSLALDDIYKEIIGKEGHSHHRHDIVFLADNLLRLLPQHIDEDTRHLIDDSRVAETHELAMGVSSDISRSLEFSHEIARLFTSWPTFSQLGRATKSAGQLIFEVPALFSILNNLQPRIKHLLKQTNRVITDHLEQINDDLFAGVLLEADLWEEKLCLPDGALSLLIKNMLEKYYQGLLRSLVRRSHEHLQLATSLVPFERRINAMMMRVHDVERELEQCLLAQDTLKTYNEKAVMEKNKMAWSNIINGFWRGDWFEPPLSDRDFCDEFQNMVAILQRVEPFCNEAYLQACDDDIERFIIVKTELERCRRNNCVPSDPFVWPYIDALVKVSLAHLDGTSASLRLTLDIVNKKKIYLEQQTLKQIKQNRVYHHTYFSDLLTRQLQPYLGVNSDYDSALSAYIVLVTPDIIKHARLRSNMDKRIGARLKKQVSKFEEQFGTDLRQMYAIKDAIARMNTYISTQEMAIDSIRQNDASPAFENRNTLAAKRILLHKLDAIVAHTDLSVRDKIERLHAIIHAPVFKKTMLAYHHYDAFTYQRLRQCVVLFFEWVGMYSFERKGVTDALVTSSQRHTFFIPPVVAGEEADERDENIPAP